MGLRARLFDGMTSALMTALLMRMGWLAHRLVRPEPALVEQLRRRLDEINSGDGSGRIQKPEHHTGMAPLAESINATLDHAARCSRFASDVSHELRSPLTALRVKLEEAQLHIPETDFDELLREGLRDIDRLESIIDDLLTLCRLRAEIATTRPGPVDVSAVVKEHVSWQSGPVPVRLRLQPEVCVNGVPTQLGRILLNLLSNAQRHARRSIVVTVRRDRDIAEMAVDDDGDGVPPADRERLFERFVRSEKSLRVDPHGAGLGLAICREIASAHGGTIHIEDSDAGGARFVVRLPAIDPIRRDVPVLAAAGAGSA
ncbi:sensor histidine kinase KdpD [Microbispora sp. GKU 823]|uniref:sensor histidine kinase n=1 Tax=Microbispora sp. GKU 823 TaxID=1652100 RepID=UPI0009A3AE6A|nr:HAMP domain-containing sensor histidine kinase [Microbispora sp. GKU 823]OPG12110.1 hypothetical protein B1L11_16470 [Microbispora sp. GKU 823]